MLKCSPVETRKNLELAQTFAQDGIDFVAIPVAGEFSKEKLVRLLIAQIDLLEVSEEG